MHDDVDAVERAVQPSRIANVPDEEADSRVVKLLAHLVLLKFVPAEDDDLSGVQLERFSNEFFAEGARPSRNQNHLSRYVHP